MGDVPVGAFSLYYGESLNLLTYSPINPLPEGITLQRH